MIPPALRPDGDGLLVRVRLTPKASRDAIGRLERLADDTEVVIAHVRAVPAEGAANAALVRLLAEALGVARSRIAGVGGPTARIKTLRVEGAAADLAERLAALVAAAK